LNIQVLDCTLRDGGYITDWKFSDKNILKILNALSSSKIDIIECGYLNDKRGEEQNSTLFKNTQIIDSILKKIPIKNIQKVVMINLGDFDVNNLPVQHTTQIDGIRLAFHKVDLDKALNISKIIIELGYKLYFQPMVTKNYTDMEFLSLIERVNKLNIYSFYIVDSFGSMNLQEFQRYMVLSDNNLNSEIFLGYHSHNNMQLAFSNAISMCNSKIQRDVILDASIYGIGRGAGNLNSELIADYLNNNFDKYYNTLPLLEMIDELLYSLMQKKPWGFSPAQYLSALYDCHPNYATYLINKNTNHIVGVKKVLENLPLSSKVSFNKELIETLYRESLLETKTNITNKMIIPKDKKVLLLASGKSVYEYTTIIESKIKSDDYTVVALNHKPDFECDYYLFTNQKRYDEFNDLVEIDKLVITSNIQVSKNIDIVLDIKLLVFVNNMFITNIASIVLQYLISQNIQKVEIAGLDGYKLNEDNYNYEESSVIVDKKAMIEENKVLANVLAIVEQKILINFITPSIFKKEN